MRQSELLTTAEVAALLRVHPKHVYRLLKKGLPSRRVGGEWRFAREDVLGWSAGSTPPPSTHAAPLLAVNGDVVVEVLLRQMTEERKPLLGMLLADRTVALEHLAARRILMAGHHGGPAPLHFEGQPGAARLARIHLVRRKVGVAFTPARRLRRLEDLRRLRLASRPPTAGVRAHLDRALRDAKTSLRALGVRSVEVASHAHAVCAVLRGEADAALATEAWAARVGLPLLPLAEEAYDLLVRAEDLGHPVVVGACEVTQSKRFAREARASGYEPREAGEIRYDE